jgi:hypothetical protein
MVIKRRKRETDQRLDVDVVCINSTTVLPLLNPEISFSAT